MDCLSSFISPEVLKIGQIMLQQANVLQKIKKPDDSCWKSDSGLDLLNMKFLGWEGITVNTELNKKRFLGGHSTVLDFLEEGDKVATLYGMNKLFYHSDIFVDELNICVGLNWTFGLRSVQNWVRSLKGPSKKQPSSQKRKPSFERQKWQDSRQATIFNFSNTPYRMSSQLSRGEFKSQFWEQSSVQDSRFHLNKRKDNYEDSVTPSMYQGFGGDEQKPRKRSPRSWDKFRFKYHGRLQIKIQNLSLKLMTGISPYDPESLEISSKLVYLDHFESELKILTQDIFLKYHTTK